MGSCESCADLKKLLEDQIERSAMAEAMYRVASSEREKIRLQAAKMKDAVEQERAAIVGWLRQKGSDDLGLAADAIEKRIHLKEL